jgi:hypothetical protein
MQQAGAFYGPAAIFPEVGSGHPRLAKAQSDLSIRGKILTGRNTIYQEVS